MAEVEYAPGICNINTKEIARRRNSGHFMLIVTLVIGGGLYLLDASSPLLAVVAVPAWLTALSYLQAKNSFCVVHGAAGTQVAHEGQEKAEHVSEEDAKTDKKKVNQIHIQAIGIGLNVGAITALLV